MDVVLNWIARVISAIWCLFTFFAIFKHLVDTAEKMNLSYRGFVILFFSYVVATAVATASGFL